MMEWNWFFSAVAQCSAAIVAIIGAFIIREALDAERNFFRNLELMNRYEKRTELLARKSRVYEPLIHAMRDEESTHAMDLVDSVYQQGGEGRDLDWFLQNVELPDFIRPEQKRSLIEKRLEMLRNGAALAASSADLAHHLDPREQSEVLDLFREVREHSISLEVLDADIKASIASVSRVRNSIRWAVFLYYTGVLVPLLLTPAGTDSDLLMTFGTDPRHLVQYGILAAITVAVTLLMTTIGNAVNRIRYPERECRGICEHSSLSFYSKYFADLEKSLL
jgi:hypothetical protein